MKKLKALADKEAKKILKVPMLAKVAECDLYERGNSYDGKQAKKADQS